MMKRTLCRLVLVLLALRGICESSGETGFRFERITMTQGLSSNIVLCFLQDCTGFLWIGTDDGLNRYDGREFKIFRRRTSDPSSLAVDTVTSLCQDRSGGIWVGTWGSGLDRLDPQTGKFAHFRNQPGNANSLGHNYVRDLFISPVEPDWLWISTWGGGLDRLHLETKRFEHFLPDKRKPGCLRSPNVQLVFADRGGTIWVGTSMGLQRFIPSTRTFDYYPTGETNGEAPDELVRCIHESPDRPGELWVGILGRGLYRFEPASRSWQKQKNFTYGEKKTVVWNVFCIRDFPGQPGDLLLGMGRGLFRFNPESQDYKQVPDLGATEKIEARDRAWTIFQDKGGVLWVSYFGSGLQKLDPYLKPIRHHVFAGNEAGAIRTIQSFAEDANGRILITDRGSDLLANGGIPCAFERVTGTMEPVDPNPGNQTAGKESISAVAVTAAGDSWFGGQWTAIRLRHGKGQPEVFKLPAPAADAAGLGGVLCIAEDTVGRVWFGTAAGVSLLDPADGTGRFFPLESAKQIGVVGHYVQDILADREGRVWAATENGLFRFRESEGQFVRIGHQEGRSDSLDDDHVNDLLQDGRGRIWVATRAGINLAAITNDRVTFRHFAPRGYSSPSIVVHSLLVDDDGDVWAGTALGIARLQPASGTFSFYDAGADEDKVEFLDGVCLQTWEGEFFFGGKNGFISFHPREWKFDTLSPPIVLTDLQVENMPLADSGIRIQQGTGLADIVIALPYRWNSISLQFAALDFHRPEKNQFAFTLADRTKDWTYLGYDRRIFLTGLKPGSYMLHVKGANSDGRWNEKGFSMAIRIRPPFWQTWWFMGLSGLFVVSLLAVWQRRRKQRWAEKIKSQLELEHFCRHFGVSRREMEIIGLLIQGKSNRTIEQELFISDSTVRNHVYNIYQKLGVKNRLQLSSLFRNFH
jgi:ligand-binding sensor domain-containing protein/DNA-binding CsgD family transcriptional regulator